MLTELTDTPVTVGPLSTDAPTSPLRQLHPRRWIFPGSWITFSPPRYDARAVD